MGENVKDSILMYLKADKKEKMAKEKKAAEKK